MRTFILLVALTVSGICHSQITERIMVDGSISVPIGDDPEGITIINTTTNRGTVSGEDGKFSIAVGLRDEIVISAIQFQEFRLIIDQKVMEAGELHVFVSEMTTELPEVVVQPFDLSGNVEVDVRRIPVEADYLPILTEEERRSVQWDFRPDAMTSPENAAMRDSFMENGLNFVNIFRALVGSRDSGEEGFDPIDEDLRMLYDDGFFREHLNIKRKNITQFILFAENNGLNEEMLAQGNELELVEFLIDQSEKFKAQGNSE